MKRGKLQTSMGKWVALAATLFLLRAQALPSFLEVKESARESEGYLLDRKGEPIQELRIHLNERRLSWVPLSNISKAAIDTIELAEDKNFNTHHGVDWFALLKAATRNIYSSHSRGASTLTMQLASFISTESKKSGHTHRTFTEKWRQIRLALEIEKAWTKLQIAEAYLNLVTFRGELVGIHAASQGLFQKEPKGLTTSESLILASLIRSPQSSLHVIEKRACLLALKVQPPLKCADISLLIQHSIRQHYQIPTRYQLAPHLAVRLYSDRAKQEHDGSIETTIDGELQAVVLSALQRQIAALQKQNVHDGAAVVIDNASGDVLAYVGSTGEMSQAKYVDGVLAFRQAGSTLKPFLYATALDKHLLTAASTLIECSHGNSCVGRSVPPFKL